MLHIIKNLLETGTSRNLDFKDNARIKVINLASLCGGSVSFLFSILNTISGNYLLAAINLATLLTLLGLIYCNYRHNFLKGPAIIMVLIPLVLCLNGILYNNNMEFYVLLVVCLGLVVFDNLRVILVILALNSILFLISHKLAPHIAIQPASEGRQFINLVIWLVLLLICLYNFKTTSLHTLAQMKTANENLTASNQAKEKLFSIVAHDMRSPLNSLSTTLELLDNEFISPEKFKELSGLLAIQTKHLNENMEVLLKWAQSQLRGIEVHPQLCNITEQATEIINLLTPLMRFKNLTITLSDNTAVQVYADPEHVNLVLRNLLTNAIKFSYPNGKIEVRIQHGEGKQIWVQVKDYGTGIAADRLPYLFNKMNMSVAGTQNEKGIGLGLQLIKEFITRNGGIILVKSQPGEGSTFSFSLPAGVPALA